MKILDETRKDYESPVTKKVQVEMEGSLCGSATITNPDDAQGRINAHKTNENFDIEGSSSGPNGWDTDVWNGGN